VTQQTETTPSDIVSLTVNDKDYKVQVQPHWPLSFVLRDRLGLFGTKVGCETGQCASCTVLADGVPVLSCLLLAMDAAGKKITTVEGLSDGITLNPLQQKFYDQEAFQCGFCTPGILMASTALLASNPKPTIDDVREALGGHICACTNFTKVVNAVTGGV
jgi:aerobic-type carbon monoxide dehydrogenase small subunit (CoxS/CutS family)